MMNKYTASFAAIMLLGPLSADAQSAKPGMENRPGSAALRGSAPANDECENAIALTVGVSCTTTAGNSDGATETLAASENCGEYTSPEAPDVWYSFVASNDFSRVDVLGNGDYDAVVEVFEGACGALNPLGCSDLNYPIPGEEEDLTESVTVATTAGNTYYVRVYYYSSPVPANLTFAICVLGGTAPPANDDCDGAEAQELAVGSTINFTGNNEGATIDPIFGVIAVWHSFTITECADVTMNFCVEGSTFQAFGDLVALNCELGEEDVIIGELGECTVTFRQLPAGTYVVPVPGAAPAAPAGEYTIEVSAAECDTYCLANSEGCDEFVANFQFAGIDNPSDCGPTYQNFTDISTNVERGDDVDVVVLNNPDAFYEGDQCAVWVDWNQNGSFDDAGEMTMLETTDEAATFTGTVSVPEDAVLGATRLRVRLTYTGDVLPCGTADYGDVEDYTVIVEQGSSVADRLAGDWSIFPNPSNGDITIRGMQITGNAQVEVRDMTGRIVYSTSRAFNAGELATFQLAGKLAAGTYSFVINTNVGRTVRPIVVR